MIRSLSLYPRTADPALLDELIGRTAEHFKGCPGCVSFIVSQGPIMGPGAMEGAVGRVTIVDFETLEAALNALDAPVFEELRRANEELSDQHFLFEISEL